MYPFYVMIMDDEIMETEVTSTRRCKNNYIVVQYIAAYPASDVENVPDGAGRVLDFCDGDDVPIRNRAFLKVRVPCEN